MRVNFHLFLKDTSSKDMHARLCSDLDCNYNSQSSCMLVGHMVVPHDKLFSATIMVFSKLLMVK